MDAGIVENKVPGGLKRRITLVDAELVHDGIRDAKGVFVVVTFAAQQLDIRRQREARNVHNTCKNKSDSEIRMIFISKFTINVN